MKIGSGSLSLSVSPVGSSMPHTAPRLLVLLPARAGQIAAHHALDRHDLGLPHQHRPALERLAIDARRQIEFVDVAREQVIRHVEPLEPEPAELREHAALVGNAASAAPSRTR